jgi:hypothetical protein
MFRRSKPQNACQRLRLAVEAMPRPAREAMLRGIDSNTIIVGAYADPSSKGVCPMLAAHRNGGRTNLASFARSWDRYTDARRPRLATKREVRTLRALLIGSLAVEDGPIESLTALADDIRRDREEIAGRGRAAESSPAAAAPKSKAAPAPTGETSRTRELRRRSRWAWILPARSLEVYNERVAAASEQYGERRVDEVLSDRPAHHTVN